MYSALQVSHLTLTLIIIHRPPIKKGILCAIVTEVVPLFLRSTNNPIILFFDVRPRYSLN